MADNADIDLYAEDIEQDFTQEEFGADGLDLYDDVIASAPLKNASSEVNKVPNNSSTGASGQTSSRPETNTLTCVNHLTTGGATSNLAPPGPYSSYTGRKYQLYVGNLTWWTTDQDITDAIVSLGIQDFIEVKFFENRSNGQSKGFCIVSFGSEQSMRLCMDKLPKKELHGQAPIVTYTSKQALNQFEAQTKARPTPTNQTTNQSRLPTHPGSAGINQSPRMIMGPPQIRNRMPPPGMNPGGQRVLQPGGPPHMGGPPGGPSNQHFHTSWQNGIRQNGPPRPPGPPQQIQPQRPGGPPPGMYQGPPPPGQGIPPRGPPPGIPGGPPPDQRGPPPRPDWNRPPGMQNPGGFMPHQQGVPGIQNMPTPGQGPMNRGPSGPIPPPQISGGPGSTNANATHSHVQSTFFPQSSGTAHQGPPHQVSQGPPQGPPQGQHGPSHAIPPHTYHNGPPITQRIHPFVGGPSASEHRSEPPALSEAEFEEIMSRNRTVSSSAIARAVSDAAAGEFASAIETLVTAISLIKQSKAANDDRCKILVSSLQDTLHGVETKSYGSRRDRSRSRERDRAHRRSRRDRSRSREYRERSRERDRDRDRDRERDKERYYADNYTRERSRSRERDRDREYRERSREDSSSRQNVRPRLKSPEPPESNSTASKSRYYEERYRERDRERDRERERERERDNSRREPERERDRERDRERERERAESSHRSSRH